MPGDAATVPVMLAEPVPSQLQRRSDTRLPSITGLRFIGAFGVFAFHVEPLIPHAAGMALWHPLFNSGQAGVSFFFVLSGFVLTWSSRLGDGTVAFWRRRFARIVPLHVLTWAMAIPVIALRFGAWPKGWPAIGSLSLFQSWIPEKSVFLGVNGVAWSLSCEVFFYALFPLVIIAVRRSTARQRWWGMACCVAALAALQLGVWSALGPRTFDPAAWGYWAVSVHPIGRLPEFLFGALAARQLQTTNRWRLGVLPAALIALAAVYLAGLFPLAIVAGWLTIIPFGLLICAAARSDVEDRSRILSASWAVRLGEWSFAFYLSHQVVLRFVGAVWPSDWSPMGQIAVDLIGAIAMCALLYHFVEVPAERALRGRTRLRRPAVSATS
jgi:peptidoglycan/LPS O-acetylase OafA/YrhL